jgi:N-terminal acetyltransferase B complex catalytic subunit
MTSYRRFEPKDLFRTGLCNLDPLTENYDVSFYLQYLAKWPELFLVAEDMNGDIVGYSMCLSSTVFAFAIIHLY